jgi:hypothetical protein
LIAATLGFSFFNLLSLDVPSSLSKNPIRISLNDIFGIISQIAPLAKGAIVNAVQRFCGFMTQISENTFLALAGKRTASPFGM